MPRIMWPAGYLSTFFSSRTTSPLASFSLVSVTLVLLSSPMPGRLVSSVVSVLATVPPPARARAFECTLVLWVFLPSVRSFSTLTSFLSFFISTFSSARRGEARRPRPARAYAMWFMIAPLSIGQAGDGRRGAQRPGARPTDPWKRGGCFRSTAEHAEHARRKSELSRL